MKERIQKIISSSGLMSRRAAEDAIADGRVTVNGLTAIIGEKADPDSDTILIDGNILPAKNDKIYIMLNKPKGFITTLSDEKGRRNVTELVKDLGCRVYPVGRLDMYSEGLLLMTNDGDFANLVMHPSHNIEKKYRTWVEGENIGVSVEYLRRPMDIDGYTTSSADVIVESIYVNGAVLLISIHEGRNRQIRKMCEQAGLKVTRLVRISEGGLILGDLKPGMWRNLTKEEIELIYPSLE